MMNESSHPSPLAAPLGIPASQQVARLIVVVEGGFDIQFLKRISRILHRDDPQVPDLQTLEQYGEIVFVPIAGSNFLHWTHRLAGLGLAEFHLLDREVPPLTAERERAVAIVNQRPSCQAVLTRKRAIENYLSPVALVEARGIEVSFGDQDDVPQLAAARHLKQVGGPDWVDLSSRSRRRMRNLAKKWLNTVAVEQMTVERLAERDPTGEIRSWLKWIEEMGKPDGLRS